MRHLQIVPSLFMYSFLKRAIRLYKESCFSVCCYLAIINNELFLLNLSDH
jgi:hypothetical protein